MMMTKIIGIIPGRMASSRFPGKPLHPILGLSMLEHVYKRAKIYEGWDYLCVSSCDNEILEAARSLGADTYMTSPLHTRALDRVAETIANGIKIEVQPDDIIINVQGDIPMLLPEMIHELIQPFKENDKIEGTMLGLPIMEEREFYDPNTLKVIHNLKGDILYTSRAPVPYCKKFSPELNVYKIYGLFAFKWHFLKKFTELSESPLEINEACDSNRLYDYGYTQRLVKFPYLESYAVDVPSDIELVERALKENDRLWKETYA